MSWELVEVSIKKKSWLSHKKATDSGLEWTIPCASGLEAGGTFTCGGAKFTAEPCVDVAQRGEVLLVTTQGDKNVKSKARRARDSSGGEEVQSEDNS